MSPDDLRIIALALMAASFGSFPVAVAAQGRPRSAWWAVLGGELLMLGTGVAIIHSWGHPLIWFRTPLAIAAGTCFVIFAWLSLVRWR